MTSPINAQRPYALKLDRAKGAIEFDNVSFIYPDTTNPALGGVSLKLQPGQVLALTGPNGYARIASTTRQNASGGCVKAAACRDSLIRILSAMK